MFAKRLTNLREKKNLYQKDIAEIFNIEQATVSNWEKGKRIPDSEMLIKLANFFEVSVDYLLGNDTTLTTKEEELREMEALKQLLIKKGFMKYNEDLTNEEIDRLMKFVNANKEFLKGDK